MTGATIRRCRCRARGVVLVMFGILTVGCDAAVVDDDDAGLDAGSAVDGGAEDAGTPPADSGTARDSGSSNPDAGGGDDDAGVVGEDAGSDAGVDAGPAETDAGVDGGPPACSCTSREVCVSGTCVFDDDATRDWVLEIHGVRSQIPAAPYFEWDTPCSDAGLPPDCDGLTVGEADIQVWVNGAGTGTVSAEPSGAISYTPPLEAMTGVLTDFQQAGVSITDMDWFSGGGDSSRRCKLNSTYYWLDERDPTPMSLIQSAAHDGMPRIASCGPNGSSGPVWFVWSLTPAP